TAGLLAAIPTGLVVLMLIAVSALGPRPRENKPLIVIFHLQPPPPARARKIVKVESSSHAFAPVHPATAPPLHMVILSRKDYAASDSAGLPTHPSGGTQSADAGAGSSSANGPNGEPMYDVAWYREPTRAELAPYMPATGPEIGSALLACRMVEHYHVED